MKIVIIVLLLASLAFSMHIVQEYKVEGATKIMSFQARGNGMLSAFTPPSSVSFFRDMSYITKVAEFYAPCENVVGMLGDFYSDDTLLYNSTTACFFHDRFSKRYFAKISSPPLSQFRQFTYYVKNDSSISEFSWEFRDETRVFKDFKAKPLFMSVDSNGFNGFVASTSQLYRVNMATGSIRHSIDFSSFTPLQVVTRNFFVYVLGRDNNNRFQIKYYYTTNMLEFAAIILDEDIESPLLRIDGLEGYAYVLGKCKKSGKQTIHMYNLQGRELVDKFAFENASPTDMIANPMFVYANAQDPARLIKISKF